MVFQFTALKHVKHEKLTFANLFSWNLETICKVSWCQPEKATSLVIKTARTNAVSLSSYCLVNVCSSSGGKWGRTPGADGEDTAHSTGVTAVAWWVFPSGAGSLRQENHQELQDAHRAMGVEVDNLREDGGSKEDLREHGTPLWISTVVPSLEHLGFLSQTVHQDVARMDDQLNREVGDQWMAGFGGLSCQSLWSLVVLLTELTWRFSSIGNLS